MVSALHVSRPPFLLSSISFLINHTYHQFQMYILRSCSWCTFLLPPSISFLFDLYVIKNKLSDTLNIFPLRENIKFFHPHKTAGGITYCYDFINKLKDLKSGAGLENIRVIYLVKNGVLPTVKNERNILHRTKRWEANWIGHILRGNCLLKQVIGGES